MLSTVIDWLLHLDKHLAALAAQHGVLVYAMLFAVIFVETGVVILPFLPGDSLLFVAGALAAKGMFKLPLLVPVLIAAAVLGDALNFAIGGILRERMNKGHKLPLVKAEHLERTRHFFERHGRKTIVIARFVPIVRTFAPFVAALGDMHYGTFLAYNLAGAVFWVVSLTGAGYAFGNVPWVGDNLTAVLLGIIAVSLLPGLIGWRRKSA